MGQWLNSLHGLFSGTWVLFLSLFIMLLGNGLQGSLVSIRGTDEGFSTLTLSLIASGYYVGFFVGSFVVPDYLKRVGYIRVFAALVAVASVAAIAYAMFVEKYTWFFMRVLTGFCFAGIYMVTESWLNSDTHNDNRAKVLSMYTIIVFLGMMLGQLLLNSGEISGYFLFALASILISVAAVPLLLTTRPAPVIEETANLSIRKLIKRSPLGVVSSLLANFISGGIIGMSAIYAKSVGMDTHHIALFVAAAYLGVILLQYPIGWVSDKIDRRKVIVVLFLLTAIIAFLTMWVHSTWGLIAMFCLLGSMAIPLYSISLAYVNDRLNPEEVLPATSALLKISGIGNMLAPVIIGYVMMRYGMQWYFGTMGAVAVIVVVFGLYRIYQTEEVNPEDVTDFAPIGGIATPAMMTLANEGIQLEFDFGEQHRRIPSDETEITTDDEQRNNEQR